MSELNEYECEMLDAVMEAFGIPDSLTRNQLMDLFGQDEATAYALVQILTREGFVAEIGKHGDFDLPQKLVLKPKGENFLKAGGFAQRFKREQDKPLEVNSTLSKLQQQNMRLQNDKLSHRSQVIDLQNAITRLKMLQYLWWSLIVIAIIAGYYLGHSAGAKSVHH